MEGPEDKGIIPNIMNRPIFTTGKQACLRRWTEEMAARNAITDTSKISYRKYFTDTGVKNNAILGLMKELTSAENGSSYGNAWRLEISSLIVQLISNGFGDVNFLDEKQIDINNTSRNTPLSLAIENGLSESICALMERQDFDINKAFITRDENKSEVKRHPFQKLSKNQNLELLISDGTCEKLFADRRIILSFDSWKSLFQLIKNTSNRTRPSLEYCLAVLRTLESMINNPRFKEKLVKEDKADYIMGEVESIKRRVVESTRTFYA